MVLLTSNDHSNQPSLDDGLVYTRLPNLIPSTCRKDEAKIALNEI